MVVHCSTPFIVVLRLKIVVLWSQDCIQGSLGYNLETGVLQSTTDRSCTRAG